MAKKQSALKQHTPYIAIVAVVAVVAVVILVLNFTGGNLAGEAGRLTSVAKTTAAVDPCQQGEKCGFVTKDEVVEEFVTKDNNQKLVFVDSSVILNFYKGDGSWQTAPTSSGNKICSDMGYKNCWASKFYFDRNYYFHLMVPVAGGNSL